MKKKDLSASRQAISLFNGDCLKVLKTLPDQSIDLILTDPPYGTTQCKWDSIIPFDLMWLELNRVIKSNGAIILFGAEPFSSALRMSNIKNYKYDWVWEKEQGTGHLNCNKQPLRKTENITVFYNKQCNYFPQDLLKLNKPKNKKELKKSVYGKTIDYTTNETGYPVNVLTYKRDKPVIHNTQKPVELLEYLIKTYTKENETVLDFTMGSGSTGVACVNINRKFIGIEKDKKYFKIAQKRINDL